VRGIPAAAGLVRRKMQPQMNTDQKEINTVGSVDILKKRQRCLKRYRLKLSPRSRVWRIRLRSDRPGARAQSLRFSEEKGSRSERDAGKAVVGMPGVFPRALGGCARFSFRAWRESRSAPHVAAGCRYDLAVEFVVGQDQPDGSFLRSGSDDRRQIRTVVPGVASRDLRQQELLIQFRDDHSLQPVPPRQRFLPIIVYPSYEKSAHRSVRQARSVDGHTNSLATAMSRTAQPALGLANRSIDSLVVKRWRKRCRVVKSGTLPSLSAWRNSRCSPRRTSA